MSSNANEVAVPVSTMLFFAGIAIIGWQVYTYLRYNNWMPVSVLTVLELMKVEWAYNPNDWMGVHNILKLVPLSAVMITSAWVVISSVN